ncbi:MAG TPA: protein translocase subunit SecD [Jatrophihabitans sp.]|nr:protein translocase subunit SecD [Jatrophihabitans sp.]
MAPPPGTLRVGRYLTALVVLLGVLYAIVFLPGQRHTPKLGIDLVGGIRVIFTARGTPTTTQMEQARQIMEDRVNGSGVTQSTVVIQGSDQIVISIPNGTNQDVAALGQPAKLNFRGVVAPAVPVTCGPYAPKGARNQPAASSSAPAPSPSPTTSSGAQRTARPSTSPAAEAPKAVSERRLGTAAAAKPRPSATRAGSPTATQAKNSSPAAPASSSAAGSGSAAPTGPHKCTVHSVADINKAVKLPDPSTVYASGGIDSTAAQGVAAQLTNFDCRKGQTEPDLNDQYYVACGTDISPGAPNQEFAFLLGPVVVEGTQISSASAQAPNVSQGQSEWTVQLKLKDSGDAKWSAYTGAHNIGGSAQSAPPVYSCGTSTPCADFVAFTLNGAVISAPVNETQISGLPTQISGNFTQSSATELANQLQYGALPLTFRLDDNEHVSATLGSSQLKAALLAGGIGLILVVLYSLLYYRGLGLVTIASLLVSGALTYAMLVILGTQIGFTLDLSGVAGFIVALGITADSFVVFFERIKDEVHEGRSMRVAVPRAWVRARRTILSADTVSFLAAAILYYFASADVKGFAFTLGLSTILDLVVVFLFTHPMISLLSRSRAFGSKRFTGLDAVRVGGVAPAEAPVGGARGSTSSVRSASRATGATATATAPPEQQTDTGGPDPAAPAEGEARRRTTPEPGTAAERAAARRARMRDQGDGTTDGKGTR